MLLIESILIVVAVVLAFTCPSLGSRWFEALERRFAALARHRTLSIVAVGITALALRAALLPIEPIPEPVVHDEFGYLLAADTFAHGRLTNPTHPMWVHFETFSEIQKPSYQCFAQPAQGMLLAFGKVVFGHPFWGVWLSIGLMCAAITWMLQGWLPPAWALIGGIVAILRYGAFGYWTDSYWGGAVGAIGGALVIGTLPRIKKSQRVRDAICMGLGLAILANSRPYEGFVSSLPIAVLLFAWLLGKNRPPWKLAFRRVLLPLTFVLFVSACGTCYYFWRVTGSPIRMPYQVDRETYAVAPYMLWQHVRTEPTYNNLAIRHMYAEEEVAGYRFFRSLPGFLAKIFLGWSFFIGPVLTLPLLLLIFCLPRNFSFRDIDRSTLCLLMMLTVSVIGWMLESFYSAHYSAPMTGVILALVLTATKRLRHWTRAGLFLTRAMLVICVVSITARAAAPGLHFPVSEYYAFAWYQKGAPTFGRAALEEKLSAMPGKQLVIVHYDADHEPFEEWVFNEADIDSATIVWAREVSPQKDRELIQYFAGRQLWRLQADQKPPQLTPYRGGEVVLPPQPVSAAGESSKGSQENASIN